MVRLYRDTLKAPARKLRKTMTEAEQRLWLALRGKQILNIQFCRQKPVGPYIVDFYAHEILLVVEVDGSQHLDNGHTVSDQERDDYLHKQGLLVLRFDNRQVLTDTAAVLEEIFLVCLERLKSPLSPLRKGGNPGPISS
ncbi:DUF559 domain-containing protein [Geomonas sp. Red32]|uniref:endonuclease domain-containing protein n=1 Tax=Geomonas sp. Red32 TaxID=2912856 RepID=UPI00202CE519|nr:DUF559 domain-containing protein [Geomonas sp. Red32]MCM0081934.1 DUF559 domain-containing protein [Geomonas sp. Red32]